MYNTIILYEGRRTLTGSERSQLAEGCAIYAVDTEPKELKRWPIEKEEEAKAELAKYKCSYDRRHDYIDIVEYALNYCELDEDGYLIGGGDYYFAEEDQDYPLDEK